MVMGLSQNYVFLLLENDAANYCLLKVKHLYVFISNCCCVIIRLQDPSHFNWRLRILLHDTEPSEVVLKFKMSKREIIYQTFF